VSKIQFPHSNQRSPLSGPVTHELEELIAALDRPLPRVEQAGEAVIARDAAALRAKAVERLGELVSRSKTSPLART
jgi:hypothetical protein